MTCSECGKGFEAKRQGQILCSKACNVAMEKRALKRARRVYRALYHWRASRDDPRDLRFVAREIAHWVAEDKAAGRGKPPRHTHDADRGHERSRVGVTSRACAI